MPFWVNEDGATAVKAQKMDQLSGLGKKKKTGIILLRREYLSLPGKMNKFVIKGIGRISILGRG